MARQHHKHLPGCHAVQAAGDFQGFRFEHDEPSSSAEGDRRRAILANAIACAGFVGQLRDAGGQRHSYHQWDILTNGRKAPRFPAPDQGLSFHPFIHLHPACPMPARSRGWGGGLASPDLSTGAVVGATRQRLR
jgi:hypothetical protein